MKKNQLLEKLEGMHFVDGIVGDPVLIETKPNGDRWYAVNIREIVEDVGIYRNIDFYVVDEGNNKEVAFFKDRMPSKSVISETEQLENESISLAKKNKLKIELGLIQQ